MSLLVNLVKEDFGISGSGRWMRSDTHSSLVVDSEKEIFYFNSRGIYGNALDYLTKVRGWKYQDAVYYISSHKNISLHTPTTDQQKFETLRVKYDKLVDIFFQNGKNNRDYWYKRLLTDDTIDIFRLGFFDGWYTVPVIYKGYFVNFQCRRDSPEKSIKFWYKDADIPPFLFNGHLIKNSKEVFIVEGLIDSILLHQMGFTAVAPTLGSAYWDGGWISLFSQVDTIYYIEDNDMAGRKFSSKVAKNLGTTRVRVVSFSSFGSKFDTIDFFRAGKTKEEFVKYVTTKYRFLYS